MQDQLLEKIKSDSHWRINIRPTDFATQKIASVTTCEELVVNSKVELRGWYYPHIPREGTTVGGDYVEGRVDWNQFRELWRFYQSEQFIHLFSVREDLIENETIRKSYYVEGDGQKVLSILGAVYQITEIFEFLSRLAKKGVYNNGGEIRLGLSGTAGRELVVDHGRAPLFGRYAATVDKIEFVRRFTFEEAAEHSKDLAIEAMTYLFQRFNWKNLPIDVFRNDQQKLLEGRIW